MATSVVRARLAATASILAMCAAAPALAQTAPATATVDDIIVTAQKREQAIQDVPIAVSAFSAETLDAMKIEGGSELMRAIPNVSFSKNNFSMYNFSIRGIGTKAISAASDPAVAVSFNNSPLIRNRLFEQEYLDVSRVEVLRGPQGTLYGRNATAGVVNMIPNLPRPDFDAMLKAEVGNYGSERGQMMVNIPLTDTFWVRAAGARTTREGFDHNTFLDTKVNGRDLYSTRLSAVWEPSSRFSSNLIWEHFSENDNRSRTGKQLCTRDPGPDNVGSVIVTDALVRGRLSQGCKPGSLFSDSSYGAPNGAGLSQIYVASGIGYGYLDVPRPRPPVNAVRYGVDPYDKIDQSKNLREISTSFDPKFEVKNDVYQLNVKYKIYDDLVMYAQTTYSTDVYKSSQDYNRYISNDIFNDSDNLWSASGISGAKLQNSLAAPGGVYTDPQLGPSRKMESLDLSKSNNSQFYQEVRLQSSFNGNYNFSLGANYLDFKTEDNYYVFNNVFTLIAEYFYNSVLNLRSPKTTSRCKDGAMSECVYVDYSDLGNLEGDGHNYFRSKNVVNTKSLGIFGEAYVDLSPAWWATLGLRYTDDKKITTPHPSQLLLGSWDYSGYGPSSGGNVVRGYPAIDDIKQSWNAWTGRAVVDWKPNDRVMYYASLSRGYKGGGANPPRADIDTSVIQYQPLPELFKPEYVTAVEIGSKLIGFDGQLSFNSTIFYYDYKDYQVSQIVDRISLNENFDAKSMGLELEASYRASRNFRVDANFGYLKTKISAGSQSIDVMDRTQGNSDWMVVRPWVQVPSNCIAPTKYVETILSSPRFDGYGIDALSALCGGSQRMGSFDKSFPGQINFWDIFGFEYNPFKDAPNGGRGIMADLSGHELPNAPRFTLNIGAQYEWSVNGWRVVARGDYYTQADSYFRVYNTEYDRLKSWSNVNLGIALSNANEDFTATLYVKNLLDDSPIVDAFTNSDDSMLTTNVFTLEPMLIGFTVRKNF